MYKIVLEEKLDMWQAKVYKDGLLFIEHQEPFKEPKNALKWASNIIKDLKQTTTTATDCFDDLIEEAMAEVVDYGK